MKKIKVRYIYPKLRGMRYEKGYSMQDMAEILNITKNCYFRKEKGYTDFNLSEVRRILELFDCNYEDIFFERTVNQKVNKEMEAL